MTDALLVFHWARVLLTMLVVFGGAALPRPRAR
jgi:hypothetical protein